MHTLLSFCLFLAIAGIARNNYATTTIQPSPAHTVLQEKFNQHTAPAPTKKNTVRPTQKMISLYLENEDLVDLINYLASVKEVNVVLPMFADAINAKVTLHLEEKVTIDQAWDILYTLLDLAGYSMIAKEDTYNIVKTSKEVVREPMPLYIVQPDDIPDTDKRIRYLYYFNNIKIADEERGDVMTMLNDILPDDKSTKPGTAPAYKKIDAATNSMVLVDKANNIKAAMRIVTALDSAEAQERPEIIELHYVTADTVDKLFNESLLKTAGDNNQARLGIKQPNNATYFKKVRIVPDMRTNRLIVFGRPQAIERVRNFINKYIDVELESGKSILHVYQLQYLDARTFAKQLENMIKSGKTGGTEQSKGVSTGTLERSFDQVIIVADSPETVGGEQPSGESRGNNNLIIAARNDDYERIKKLIEQLDTPQPQVIIEILIADLTVQDIATLGANIRNPLGTGLSDNVNFQSAQISDFLTNTVTNPSTIQADLLRRAFNASGAIVSDCDSPGTTPTACFSAAPFFAPGTTLFSFNDPATGQTWGIAEIRKFLDGRKVLTRPHIITTNNTKAEVNVMQERLAIDQGSGSAGGTTTQTRKWIPAPINITIIPRISSVQTVNLQVIININQFTTAAATFSNNNPSTANQITRNVTTNANVRSGSVLALGGLTRIDTATDRLETPLLARIPIIGWLFKERTNTINKNNLTVFISPTIIEPRVRGGIGTYTKNQVQLAKGYAREGMLFDNLRDPITRWFFRTQSDAESTIDDFISQDEFIAPTIFDTGENRQKVITTQNNKQEKKSTIVAQAKPKEAPKTPAPPSAPAHSSAPADTQLVLAQSSPTAPAPKTVASQSPAVQIAQTTTESAHGEFNQQSRELKTLVAELENPFMNPKERA